MRLARLLILLLTVCLLMHAGLAQAQESGRPAGTTFRAFLIYDATVERIVASYNRDHQQPIASLTKLMTAILACEHLRFDGRYVLTSSERETFGVETLRADKMLELMLVPSNNSVCKTIARIVAGGENSFTQLMNQRAHELGLTSTHFANASGLPAEGQTSTLDDLLQLTRVALLYPSIRHAMSMPRMELAGHTYEATLKPLYDRHAGLWGGKTGYTKAAGRCLVLLYQAQGGYYIVITLGSKSVKDGFRDAELLLSCYGLYDGPVGAWQ